MNQTELYKFMFIIKIKIVVVVFGHEKRMSDNSGLVRPPTTTPGGYYTGHTVLFSHPQGKACRLFFCIRHLLGTRHSPGLLSSRSASSFIPNPFIAVLLLSSNLQVALLSALLFVFFLGRRVFFCLNFWTLFITHTSPFLRASRNLSDKNSFPEWHSFNGVDTRRK